jgi:plasmid rolling circle replication initiator protein Rep
MTQRPLFMKNTKNQTQSQHHSHHESYEASEIPLIDLKSSGKERPWRRLKDQSMAVAEALMQTPELVKYGEAVVNCGTNLLFGVCKVVEHGKKLLEAFFCQCRMCTSCQSRKSLVIRKQTFDLVTWHKEKHSTDVALLFTVTVPNVVGESLNKKMDEMFKAWGKLMRKAPMKKAVRSWARFFELSYNEERGDYHPHFHALFLVPKRYFEKSSGLYIERNKALKFWQEVMKDITITQVDIRPMRGKGGLESLVAEVAKYATKPISYIKKDENGNSQADPSVVREMFYALKGRRLVSYGGVFKKIRKERRMIDVENADLVTLEEAEEVGCEDGKTEGCGPKCKECNVAFGLERYLWDFNKRNFFLKREEPWAESHDMAFEEAEIEDKIEDKELASEVRCQETPRSQTVKRSSILLEALKIHSMKKKKELENPIRSEINDSLIHLPGPP